jgi:enediyne biosynthesis protein E4
VFGKKARKLPIPVLAAVIAAALSGCGAKSAAVRQSGPFREATRETGLDFVHQSGAKGNRYMVEMTAPGVALFDYDNDGDLDVFLVQSGPLERGHEPDPAHDPHCKLFRNDLQVLPDGPRVVKFTDVTAQAGLNLSLYGQGVIAGDYDGDGWVDLYVTAYGRNHLLHNNGDGTFRDVTAEAGVDPGPGWHTSASWVDYDRDGRLDLFVCRYLRWDFDIHKTCRSQAGNSDYCGPQAFEPMRSVLYHNLGNGRFEDVSRASRISSKAGAALGVVAADVDGDGWPDLLVANDGMANHLWMNRRDGTFAEEAMMRGSAYNGDGAAEANMGVIAADFANRGLVDFFITHLRNEHATYYRNLGNGQFEDATAAAGLDAFTRPFTGFGALGIDFDNDGWLDIFAANGEVRIIDAQLAAGLAMPMRQRAFLFRNLGGERPRFEEVANGDFLKVEDVGRGAAAGDLDNDGAIDVVICNNSGPVRLLLNQAAQGKKWIGFRLTQGAPTHRADALGAVATLRRSGKPPLIRRAATDGSYLSSSDARILFGLGDSPAYDSVTVRWPDGVEEEWRGLPAGRYHELVRGSGVAMRRTSSL